MSKKQSIVFALLSLAALSVSEDALAHDFGHRGQTSIPVNSNDTDTSIDVNGDDNSVEAEVYGDGAQLDLSVSGNRNRIRHLQFGPSTDDTEYVGSVVEDRYVPACATSVRRVVRGDGRAHVSVPSCQ
jgi:hypothetical protein